MSKHADDEPSGQHTHARCMCSNLGLVYGLMGSEDAAEPTAPDRISRFLLHWWTAWPSMHLLGFANHWPEQRLCVSEMLLDPRASTEPKDEFREPPSCCIHLRRITRSRLRNTAKHCDALPRRSCQHFHHLGPRPVELLLLQARTQRPAVAANASFDAPDESCRW